MFDNEGTSENEEAKEKVRQRNKNTLKIYDRTTIMTEWHPLRSIDDELDKSKTWKELDRVAEERGKNIDPADMPSMDHATMNDYRNVYEPSDDTYLLLDAIKADMIQRQQRYENDNNAHSTSLTRPIHILEIGCGSGAPIVYLTKCLTTMIDKSNNGNDNDNENNNSATTTTTTDRHDVVAFATDINGNALEFTKKTAIENNVHTCIELIQCDLASSLLSRCQSMIDIILFNPPYVPTPDDEIAGTGIEISWAGGTDGRVVIDKAITQIVQLLSSNKSKDGGICYMITVDDNLPEDIAKQFAKYNCTMIPWVRRRACNEYLTVQKITKNY